MSEPESPLPRELCRRWGGGLLFALALHGAAAGAALYWREASEPPPGTEAAMLIDLTPLEPVPAPAAIPAPQPEPIPEPASVQDAPAPAEPPPPEPIPPEPVPPEPLREPEIPQPEPPPPVKEVEVPLPPPPEPPKPVEKPPEAKPVDKKPPEKKTTEKKAAPRPRPVTTAATPPSVVAPAAPTPATPAPAATPSPHIMPSWQMQVLAHLERRKRYPRTAQMRREEGTVRVRFVIDRSGTVLSFRLDGSSGSPTLDEEVLSLIERASPLPAPPDDIARDRLEMVAPIHFALR